MTHHGTLKNTLIAGSAEDIRGTQQLKTDTHHFVTRSWLQ